MESIIKNEIIKHLNLFKLINRSQHGITKRRSYLTNLLEFFQEVTDAIDKGKPFDCIYFDFAKAFDKVPHLRLIQKVKAHGVDGNVAKWIIFLVNWKKAVCGYKWQVLQLGKMLLVRFHKVLLLCIRTVVIFYLFEQY